MISPLVLQPAEEINTTLLLKMPGLKYLGMQYILGFGQTFKQQLALKVPLYRRRRYKF
jgi:hypothetical protein